MAQAMLAARVAQVSTQRQTSVGDCPADAARRRLLLLGTAIAGTDSATVWATTKQHATNLAIEIKRSDRPDPLVGLAINKEKDAPSFAVDRVREIVGPHVGLVVISWRQVVKVNYLLPKTQRLPRGALRVWWPMAPQTLIPEPAPGREDAALEELGRAYKAGLGGATAYVQMLEARVSELGAERSLSS